MMYLHVLLYNVYNTHTLYHSLCSTRPTLNTETKKLNPKLNTGYWDETQYRKLNTGYRDETQYRKLNTGYRDETQYRELNTGYRDETQYRKHGFNNGVRQFCRHQCFLLIRYYYYFSFVFYFCFLVS